MICGMHEFMQTWGYRIQNPYFFKTKIDGNFKIDTIPPGDYVVKAWHYLIDFEFFLEVYLSIGNFFRRYGNVYQDFSLFLLVNLTVMHDGVQIVHLEDLILTDGIHIRLEFTVFRLN